MTKSSLFTGFVAALLSLSAIHAFAQSTASAVSPIKNGDKATFEYITYDTRGREIYEANKVVSTGQYEITDDTITITYVSGRKDIFDKDLGIISSASLGQVKDTKNVFLRWKPDQMSVDKKSSITFSFLSTACGNVESTLRDITTRESSRVIMVKGKEIKIPVTEVILDGKWSGSCGAGKQYYEIAYSAGLGQVIELKRLNFRPDSFLNVGNARRLISLD